MKIQILQPYEHKYLACSCDALLGLMMKCESFAMSEIPSSIGPPASFNASSMSVSVELCTKKQVA